MQRSQRLVAPTEPAVLEDLFHAVTPMGGKHPVLNGFYIGTWWITNM